MNAPPASVPAWLEGLYPFKPKRFVASRNAVMSYLDEGPRVDEAVLMLHGNPTWSFHFRELIGELSSQLRCIAPDHIGMGLSQKPQAHDYTLAGRIADISALVASLGLRKVHLVVHDWGGAIGFGYASKNPGMVGKIVILNTAAFSSRRLPLRIALCRMPGLGEFLVRGLNGFAEPATWMATKQKRLSWDERRGYLYPYGSWNDRVGVHRFVRDIPMEPRHPSRALLDSIGASIPSLANRDILIGWGMRDFCFDESFLSRWRGLLPSARVHAFENAGHYVLEDAGQALRRLISEFFIPTHP